MSAHPVESAMELSHRKLANTSFEVFFFDLTASALIVLDIYQVPSYLPGVKLKKKTVTYVRV